MGWVYQSPTWQLSRKPSPGLLPVYGNTDVRTDRSTEVWWTALEGTHNLNIGLIKFHRKRCWITLVNQLGILRRVETDSEQATTTPSRPEKPSAQTSLVLDRRGAPEIVGGGFWRSLMRWRPMWRWTTRTSVICGCRSTTVVEDIDGVKSRLGIKGLYYWHGMNHWSQVTT